MNVGVNGYDLEGFPGNGQLETPEKPLSHEGKGKKHETMRLKRINILVYDISKILNRVATNDAATYHVLKAV